jgi:hypothetical protein
LIVFKANGQIQLNASLRPLSLLSKIVVEVFRKLPEMAVNINNGHGLIPVRIKMKNEAPGHAF